VIERVFEKLSFVAPDKSGEDVKVNAAYVEQHLGDLTRNTDLSRYVL
jgi:ATP-dependent HslUV protease ATP-binding subunit HslU